MPGRPKQEENPRAKNGTKNGTWHVAAGAALLALSFGVSLSGPARADAVEDFYRGKTVSVIVGYNPGGGYDTYARLFGRYFGKYIPGRPNIVVQNMGGAASLKAGIYIYNVAPKDGTVVGVVSRDLTTEPILGEGKFDVGKVAWIGSMSNEVSLCATWHTSASKTWDDLLKRVTIFGASSGGADTDLSANLIANLLGAKLKMVQGYPGGNGINLAMERGEIEGRCGWSWTSVQSRSAEWLRDKKINLVLQFALEKSPDLPNVPLIMDVAKTDEQRQILKLLMARQDIARPVIAAKGVPAERLAALRKAFDDTMKDAEFIAEAKKAELDVLPTSGAAIEALLLDVYKTPKDIAAKAKQAIEPPAKH